MITRYVLGFLFNDDLSSVLLIEKKRPTWQAGKLNGIGGHIEEGEAADQAMRREFLEETGVDVGSWRQFLELTDENHFHIACYFAVSNEDEGNEFELARSMTDERVVIAHCEELSDENTVPNVRWMVPMAISFLRHAERAKSFVVLERC